MAEKKLTKKEREEEFTTIDENEDIFERGRRASYKVNNAAEKRIKALTTLKMGGIIALLKKGGYKATKKVADGIKKVFKGIDSAVTPSADDLERGVQVVVKQTAKVHAKKFKYEYKEDRVDRAIKKSGLSRLSKKLHKGNKEAMMQFGTVLFKGMKEGQGAIKLAKQLTSIKDIVAGDIDLPKHIKEIESILMRAARINDPIERAAQLRRVRKTLKKHRQYIDDLTRAGEKGFQHLGIRGATKRFAKGAEALLNDVEKLNESNVNLIVDRWRKSKTQYYQTRVTRTETSKMYAEYNREYWQELQTDGIVEGVDVLLSHSHPEPDICDELQGRYDDIKTAPLAPHHPNCICRNAAVISNETRKDGGLSPNKRFKKGARGKVHKERAA
jgi:hypothetical protein